MARRGQADEILAINVPQIWKIGMGDGGLKIRDESFYAAQAMMSEPLVRVVGPFRGGVYRLVVDDCQVPYVYLYKRADTPEDWTIILDDRFAADVNEDELLRWGYIFANAMAVAGGFSCHGSNSVALNRHARRLVEFD